MRVHLLLMPLLPVLVVLSAAPALAQGQKPPPVVEAIGGYTGFADDGGLIPHAVIGGGARLFATRRIAIGPEILYMVGPKPDHDFLLSASVTFDLRREIEHGTARRVVPYLVANAGQLRHWGEDLPPGRSSTGLLISFGGGARLAIGPRIFVAPELRFGVEPHLRFCVSVGIRPGRP